MAYIRPLTAARGFMRRKLTFLWFFLGLGSGLQIVASLSISELFSLIAGPYLFTKYSRQMRRDGVMPFFVLALCVFGGCVVACFVNDTSFAYALRGYAVTSIIPCSIIVSYWLIRKNPNGFKWLLLGLALSPIVGTFVFQKSVEVSMLADGGSGMGAVAAIVQGPIFWISRLKGAVLLLTEGWYLHTPVLWDVPAALFMALFSLLTTVSGRSTSLCAFAFVAIMLIGGKRLVTMRRRFCANFFLVCVLGVAGVFLAKTGYQVAAERGWLGEDAYKKYISQTGGDKSLKALLLGGRMESFCGLIACVDRPIVGFGPWAMDNWGYMDEFLTKYGKPEDVEKLLESNKKGRYYSFLIPCHAYITEFWLWYGVFGLLFWLYVLFVFVRYLRQDCWAVPQWFAWLACSIPGYCWGIFFSPFGDRFSPILFVVACLMARAVRKGTMQLPLEMQQEIAENEMKRGKRSVRRVEM